MGPSALLDLLRVRNAAMAATGVAAGAVVAGATATHLVAVALAGLSAALVAGGGNSLNDAADARVDAEGHPDRPIPRGDATVRQARVLAMVAFTAGIGVAAVVNEATAAVAAVATLLLVAYEGALKERGFVGNVAVSLLVGALFVHGAAAVNRVAVPVLTLAALAVLANLGREILKDAEDREADAGRRTIARTRGPRFAAGVAAAALVLAVLLSPLPLLVEPSLGLGYVPGAVLADAGFLAAAAQGFRSPAKAQRTAKASMGIALVGFLAGRAPGVGA